MLPNHNHIESVAECCPLVSVVVPSYNHAKYISAALDSVLSQDFFDFELLISDDNSSDSSWEIISGFSDLRIRSFRQETRLGPVGNLVFLIKETRGKYVALLNSDDAWYQGKLGKQVAVMESQPHLGACFTWADLVDDQGLKISGPEAIWSEVFRQQNRNQSQWLRFFFFKGNCLCHPSVLVRKEIYSKLGFYNPGFKQLPDFEMWIRLVKHYPIYIIQENLVAHLRDGKNSSTVSSENLARNLTELVEIFATFFDEISDEVFIDGFVNDFLLNNKHMTSTHLRCEKFLLLLNCAFAKSSGRAAAISLLIRNFLDPDFEKVLRDEYNFSVFDLYRLTGVSGLGYFCMQAMHSTTPGCVGRVAGLPVMSSHFICYLVRLVRRLLKTIRLVLRSAIRYV